MMSIKDAMLHTLSVTFKEIMEKLSLIKSPRGNEEKPSLLLSFAYENIVFFRFLGSLVEMFTIQ